MKRVVLSVIGLLASAYSTASQAQVITLTASHAFANTETRDAYETGTILCAKGDLVVVNGTIVKAGDILKGTGAIAKGSSGVIMCAADVQN